MRKLFEELKNKSFFFSLLFICLFVGVIYVKIAGGSSLVEVVKSTHPFWLNVLLINYTFLGDGIFAIGLCLVYFFVFKKYQTAQLFLYSFILVESIIQVIRNIIDYSAPKIYFEAGQNLFLSDVVIHNKIIGFASGHTATAFAIATSIVLQMKNKKGQLLVFSCAVGVGFSRIYLAQHFLIDIISGAFIGTVCSVICYTLVINNAGTFFNNQVKRVTASRSIWLNPDLFWFLK